MPTKRVDKVELSIGKGCFLVAQIYDNGAKTNNALASCGIESSNAMITFGSASPEDFRTFADMLEQKLIAHSRGLPSAKNNSTP